jgi:hypothetical protein
MALKETEYGGADTDRTQGIQPMEAEADLKPFQRTRLLYATDPTEVGSGPDRTSTPAYHQYESYQT